MVAELVDAGVDLLFVWGGDGTVRQCIEAVGTAPITLAILLPAQGICLPAVSGSPRTSWKPSASASRDATGRSTSAQ